MPRISGTEIKVVGKSGQISLGKAFAGKALRVEHRIDGTIVLTSVSVIPTSQLWTLEEPNRSRIARGLTWAAARKAEETDIDSLMSKRPKRPSPRTRAGRR